MKVPKASQIIKQAEKMFKLRVVELEKAVALLTARLDKLDDLEEKLGHIDTAILKVDNEDSGVEVIE